MSRKIIDQIFQDSPSIFIKNTNHNISIKEWKTILSSIDNTQDQVIACSKKTDLIYSKVIKWMGKVKDKLEEVSQSQKKIESKILNLVQSKNVDHNKLQIMELMKNHGQLINSYDEQMNSVKSTVSKSEYKMYQLLEQIKIIRNEINILNNQQKNHKNTLQKNPPYIQNLNL